MQKLVTTSLIFWFSFTNCYTLISYILESLCTRANRFYFLQEESYCSNINHNFCIMYLLHSIKYKQAGCNNTKLCVWRTISIVLALKRYKVISWSSFFRLNRLRMLFNCWYFWSSNISSSYYYRWVITLHCFENIIMLSGTILKQQKNRISSVNYWMINLSYRKLSWVACTF